MWHLKDKNSDTWYWLEISTHFITVYNEERNHVICEKRNSHSREYWALEEGAKMLEDQIGNIVFGSEYRCEEYRQWKISTGVWKK